MAFFGPGLRSFFSELRENNSKEWFDAHKAQYEVEVRDASHAFIDAVRPALVQLSPELTAVGKGRGSSLFRIYRDVRFSKDKRPYKTNAGLWFQHQAGKGAPGLYLGLEAEQTVLGAGCYALDGPSLRAVRDHIVAEPVLWSGVKAELEAAGWSFMGREDVLKRAPQGYPADHEHVEDLKLKRFAAMKALPPKAMDAADFPTGMVALQQATQPLMHFLCEALGLPY